MLKSQTSAGEDHNKENSSEELIQREKIEDTPFTLITMDGVSFLTLGKFRMSEELEATEENKQILINKVKNKDWTLILDTVAALVYR